MMEVFLFIDHNLIPSKSAAGVKMVAKLLHAAMTMRLTIARTVIFGSFIGSNIRTAVFRFYGIYIC